MTVKDILELDSDYISGLLKSDKKQLRKITSQLSSAAKKRVKRISSKDIVPPAVKAIQKTGLKPLKTLTDRQVLSQLKQLRTFLLDPQSTAKGAKEFARQTAVNLGFSPDELSQAQLSKLLNVWGRLKERYSDVLGYAAHYAKVLDFLHDEVTNDSNIDVSLLLQKAEDYISELYEQSQGVDTSDFFTIEGGF